MADPQFSDLPQGAKVVKAVSAPQYGDLPPGAKVVNSATLPQSDPNNTGIVGPDQTALPESRIANSLENAKISAPEPLAGPGGTPRFGAITQYALDKVQNALRGGGRPDAAVDVLGGMAIGPLRAAHGVTQLPEHPVKGTNEIVRGVGQTVALPSAVLNPSTMAMAAPAIVTQAATQKGLELLGADKDWAELGGNVAGGLAGYKTFQGMKPPPLAKITTPTQESAFNVLHPENAVAKESVLPDVRNAAAQQGVGKVPKGRAGVELPQKVIQGSIDNHEAQVQAIKQPYMGAVADNSAAADAALSKITPEMRASAASGNKSVASAISQIEDVANRARSANTVALTDQLRHSWNDELSSELSKSAASQDVSPAATQAKRVAASALRKGFYDTLADLSGRDDVRDLAQREGSLIEAKAGVTKTAQAALKSKRNDLGSSPRIQAAANAAKKINLAKPMTSLSFLPDLVRSVIDPQSQTPAGQYQARVARSLGDLGPSTPDAPLYTTPTPTGLLNAAPTELGPSSIGNPTSPAPPIASTTRAQRLGVTPPSAGGTFEHIPYNSQANSSTLPNGVRTPKQIGVGPDIRGLLPAQVESAIGLPEKSQSTLTNGRTIESPASNEGVIPSLIRDFVNGKTPSENPDITAMKNATAHNSPEQAAAFNEQGAQQLFGRPYGTLSVPERLQAIRKGTELQTSAMNTSGASGHSNVGGGSLEELARGSTLKVNPRTGVAGVHGGSIDVGNGEAVLRQRPDGSLEVANNNSGVSDSEILKRFGRNAAETYGKPGQRPGTIELIHRSGEHGDVPINRVSDYLSSGEYRLAPRRTR